ncbi:uncharacterized protein N7459_009168 [Penicillium hispanicum]|uniref:uncharacterized protein n=1 Tax=Penicillium hispanicum TaxID=1080232 RepID=UPI002541F9DC|nr:uncharacterized protein N7459_009168 [Penicillium hispanicum]KAJ5569738.1 hypothetical protein N7459_009168 [Penicillium hispanicum]
MRARRASEMLTQLESPARQSGRKAVSWQELSIASDLAKDFETSKEPVVLVTQGYLWLASLITYVLGVSYILLPAQAANLLA